MSDMNHRLDRMEKAKYDVLRPGSDAARLQSYRQNKKDKLAKTAHDRAMELAATKRPQQGSKPQQRLGTSPNQFKERASAYKQAGAEMDTAFPKNESGVRVHPVTGNPLTGKELSVYRSKIANQALNYAGGNLGSPRGSGFVETEAGKKFLVTQGGRGFQEFAPKPKKETGLEASSKRKLKGKKKIKGKTLKERLAPTRDILSSLNESTGKPLGKTLTNTKNTFQRAPMFNFGEGELTPTKESRGLSKKEPLTIEGYNSRF